MQQLKDMSEDTVSLTELADELREKLTHVQTHDVEHKAADAQEKFSQLQDAVTNR